MPIAEGTAAFVGAGISAAGNLAGGAVSGVFGKRNAKLQYKNWKKSFDYAAEYNSPVNQLKRLYDAGINPLYNSEYGGTIGDNPMTTGSLPESYGDFGLSQAAAKYLELQQNAQQIDINRTRADAQNANDYAHAGEAIQNAKLTEIKSQTELKSALANIRAIDAQTNLTKEETEFRKAQTAQAFAYIKAQKEEVMQNWQRVMQGWKQQEINEFNARTNSSIGWYNAVTDRSSQQELASHYQRSDKIAGEEMVTHRLEYGLERKKFDRMVKQQDWQGIKDAVSAASHNVFGVKVANEKDVQKMVELYEALTDMSGAEVDNMPKDIGLDTLDFLSLAATFIGGSALLKQGAKFGGNVVTRMFNNPKPFKGFNIQP